MVAWRLEACERVDLVVREPQLACIHTGGGGARTRGTVPGARSAGGQLPGQGPGKRILDAMYCRLDDPELTIVTVIRWGSHCQKRVL